MNSLNLEHGLEEQDNFIKKKKTKKLLQWIIF